MKDMRDRGVTPHVAQRTNSAVDGRTTRHPSYGVSQKDSQVGGGDIGVDEDGGRVPAHSVSGSGAHRTGGVTMADPEGNEFCLGAFRRTKDGKRKALG